MIDTPDTPLGVVDPLLDWSRDSLRDLPWRLSRDPWEILVSEVMLQQTQVARVLDRWPEFLAVFPTATECANRGPAAVIEQWAGLGYNRRAVNLWRCAVEVRDRFEGRLPGEVATLESLPGIGPYTARAVAVFAFERHAGVVDTNVGRLLARWTGRPLSSRQAQALADDLVPAGRSWRWNQSLFDFAEAICTKRSPGCVACPLAEHCSWRGTGDDPAVVSAGVSKRQARFEGSRRQVRGRILGAARRGDVPRSRLLELARPDDTVETLEGIVADLVAEGLLEDDGAIVRLPQV